jgi:hypothetical protein
MPSTRSSRKAGRMANLATAQRRSVVADAESVSPPSRKRKSKKNQAKARAGGSTRTGRRARLESATLSDWRAGFAMLVRGLDPATRAGVLGEAERLRGTAQSAQRQDAFRQMANLAGGGVERPDGFNPSPGKPRGPAEA